MKCSRTSSSARLERKTVERNRRMHMKGLCFKLASLVPASHHLKEGPSQQDQLDVAAAYIKKLRENIEVLKEKRAGAAHIVGINKDISDGMMIGGLRFPVIEVRDLGSTVEVVLVSGLNKNFMLCDVISVLEEEGAEVVNVSFSHVANKVFHTIHSQVTSSRVGFESSRVYERLKELVH